MFSVILLLAYIILLVSISSPSSFNKRYDKVIMIFGRTLLMMNFSVFGDPFDDDKVQLISGCL